MYNCLNVCKITDPHREYEQTNILLDQLQNTFFSHITCTGGGGGTIIEMICLL